MFPNKKVTLAKRYYEFILSSYSNEYSPIESFINDFNRKTYSELASNPIYEEKVAEYKKSIALDESIPVDSELFDPEIILLGTTCALPSKHRNNSSILICNKTNNTSKMNILTFFI